jgi:hypothetical protein
MVINNKYHCVLQGYVFVMSILGFLNWGPKLGSQIGVPNWGPKLGSQIRVSNRDLYWGSIFGVQNGGPVVHIWGPKWK